MTYSNNPRSIKAGSGITITGLNSGTGSEAITISAPGGGNYCGYYGDFYSDQNQTNPVINTAHLLTLNQNRGNDGVNLVSNSRILFPHEGVYNLTVNAQVNITQGGPGNINLWLVQNGFQVPASNSIVTVEGGGRSNVISRRFFPKVDSGDYVELYWSSDNNNLRLAATGTQTNPTRPSTPSASVTVQFIHS